MIQQVRVARPVQDVASIAAMYQRGLNLREIGSFHDHDEFDGVMLADPGKGFHFEFTVHRVHPVKPSPTSEDLLVFYIPELRDWEVRCAAMLEAGFVEVDPRIPYWKQRGRTFQDPDRYRVVIERAAWNPQ